MTNNSNFNPLFQMSVEEFVALQRRLIKEELHAYIGTAKSGIQEKKYLNFAESAAYLGISKPTFSKLRKKGFFNAIQVSENRVLFDTVDLENYLNNHKDVNKL